MTTLSFSIFHRSPIHVLKNLNTKSHSIWVSENCCQARTWSAVTKKCGQWSNINVFWVPQSNLVPRCWRDQHCIQNSQIKSSDFSDVQHPGMFFKWCYRLTSWTAVWFEILWWTFDNNRHGLSEQQKGKESIKWFHLVQSSPNLAHHCRNVHWVTGTGQEGNLPIAWPLDKGAWHNF